MTKSTIYETDLYPPIKQLFEKQGYQVKSEIGAADVVGVRGNEDPVIIELKTGFSLSLFHQAISRQAISDLVYIAVPRTPGKAFQKSLKCNLSMSRRLGIGLITVRLKDGFVEVHADPEPYKPRQSKVRKQRLLREFEKRVGDPNKGGSTRRKLVTAYRQDALRCAIVLCRDGPKKAAEVSRKTQVEKARNILSDDHYGWFERVARGIYQLTPKGHEELVHYQTQLPALSAQISELDVSSTPMVN